MTASLRKSSPDSDPQDGTNLLEEFRTLALRYAEIGAKEGVKIRPFLSPEMPLFQQNSPEEKKSATFFLKTVVGIHEETLAAGDDAIDSARLVWRALSKFSVVPAADTFARLTKDDVVLIYNEKQSVMFWNLQFFKYSSFTVEQVFCGKWWMFTKRDEAIFKNLSELVRKICTGEINGIFDPGIPGHMVEELQTEEKLKTWHEIPWGTTLTKKGEAAGFLLTHRIRILE
jgi:hypothetical protein